MRVLAVLTAALLLSGCAFVQHELAPAPPPATTSTAPAPAPKPPEPPLHPRRPAVHVEPAPPAVQSVTTTPAAPPPPDYGARCHAMADNRADDAKQLGASPADFAKVQADTYRDCMAQSVK
ncbi:MAG: hypothetical protein WDN03_18695 [Rhizomicrobium sp.]